MNDIVLPLRYRRAWVVCSAALVAIVVVGSLMPGGHQPKIPLGDKWQHFLTYFGLAIWFSGVVRRSGFLWVAGGLLALGGLMEVLQAMATTARSADIRDMAANTLGVAPGLTAAAAGLAGWVQKVEAWLGAPSRADSSGGGEERVLMVWLASWLNWSTNNATFQLYA